MDGAGVFCYDNNKKCYWLFIIVPNYVLALLLIHSLRPSICVCRYLYMLSATFHDQGNGADDPDHSVNLPRSTANLSCPDLLYIIRGNQDHSQGDPVSSFPLWMLLCYFVLIMTSLYGLLKRECSKP